MKNKRKKEKEITSIRTHSGPLIEEPQSNGKRIRRWPDFLKRRGNHLFVEYNREDLSGMRISELRHFATFLEDHLSGMIKSKTRLIERILEKGKSIDDENSWDW